ncbi:MAG: MFS transporter [Rubrobacter sp.]|nr:MFS transporter [Rubrobacter sp.]
MSALFPPFVRVALDGGALELGWLMSSQAVGGLIGGVVVGSVAARLSPSRLLGLSAVLFGLIDLAIFLYPAFIEGIALGLILFVLVGIPVTGVVASLQTLLQRSTKDHYRGACLRRARHDPSAPHADGNLAGRPPRGRAGHRACLMIHEANQIISEATITPAR